MNNEISNKLRSLRIEKGLSKQEMAEKLSLELTAYNRLESGRVNTWGKYFIEICVIFSITPSAFFNDIIIVEKTFVSKTSVFDESKIK
jgi:transcriptional regulator with XRE-family HTH domain